MHASVYGGSAFGKGCSVTERKNLSGKIRLAKLSDAKAILEIYAPYVEKTSITFEYEVPSLEEFSGRVADVLKKYPWLVYEEDGKILGYAYGSADRTRAAYQWTAGASVYISEEARGKGIGTALYDTLLDILKKQNFCICYASVNDDNVSSIKMHEKYGFKTIGIRKNCGFKHGAWHSIIVMEKILNEFSVPPTPIIPIGELEYEF